ncbi:MAG: hypothetical protein U1F48_06890 [Burkholderiales bacterium]
MSYAVYEPRPRDDVVAIPRIWLTLLLSLLLHGVLLWIALPHLKDLRQGSNALSDLPGALAVQLTPKAAEPSTPSLPTPPSPPPAREAPPAPRTTPVPRKAAPEPKRTAPPVLTAPAPVAPPPPVVTPAVPPPPVVTPAVPPPTPAPPAEATPPAPPPLDTDLASYIERRRRARGESGDASAPGDAQKDAETARRDRLVAMNLGNSTRSSTVLGNEPKNGGGTFQIRTLEYAYAEFTFYGWNKEINRRAFQVIEVRKGGDPDINTAVVRKIISIIREHEQGDFRWESKRLGRDLILSARPADNAALESFMMQEFFTSSRQAR